MPLVFDAYIPEVESSYFKLHPLVAPGKTMRVMDSCYAESVVRECVF